MLFLPGLLNGKSASNDKQDENEEEFDIALLQYPVVLKDHKDHTFNKREIVLLSVLLLKAKIKKRSTETTAAAGKRLLSYLSDKGLGEKQQYYVRRNKSNISFLKCL